MRSDWNNDLKPHCHGRYGKLMNNEAGYWWLVVHRGLWFIFLLPLVGGAVVDFRNVGALADRSALPSSRRQWNGEQHQHKATSTETCWCVHVIQGTGWSLIYGGYARDLTCALVNKRLFASSFRTDNRLATCDLTCFDYCFFMGELLEWIENDLIWLDLDRGSMLRKISINNSTITDTCCAIISPKLTWNKVKDDDVAARAWQKVLVLVWPRLPRA